MKRLNHKELVTFCSQLAMILRAGISSLEGVTIMKEDMEPGEGRKILDALYEKLEMTGNLHMAMREIEVFPEYVCNMTEIGETSGRLDEVMEGLADYYDREDRLCEALKNALTYPMMMLGLMAVIIVILMTKVMPVFQSVFEQLGGGLTGISRSIMNLGLLMNRYSWGLAILLVLVLAGAGYPAFSQKGRDRLRRYMERSGIFGKTAEKMACAKAAQGMNLCIRSGLDIDQSLEMAERLVDHEKVKEKMAECRKRMTEGEPFDRALEESHLFSGVYGKMIAIGVRTGAVDQVMEKVAGQYEEEVTDRLQNTVAMIEPAMVAVLSAMVGLILLSVMLPLMSIMTNLG